MDEQHVKVLAKQEGNCCVVFFEYQHYWCFLAAVVLNVRLALEWSHSAR